MKNKNLAFTFIMFSAFFAVMGIGLIIPNIVFILHRYIDPKDAGKIALMVGLLTSVYSLCQFFAAPVLGALSDRFGRRPVLLTCLLGSAIGYFLFGIGGALWVLFLSRIIDGLTGGDISTLFAYIADITEPQDRGKKFGQIGAIVGIGFMIGPALGGLLAKIDLSAPFYAAAGVTLLNVLFGYFVLPESLDKKHRMADFTAKHLNPFTQLQSVLKKPLLRRLFFISFFYFLPFAFLQGISSVFTTTILHWTALDIGLLFLLIGAIDIFVQGFLAGKIIPKFGEFRLVLLAFILASCAYLLNSFVPAIPVSALAIAGTLFFGFASGLFEPAMGGLISSTAEPSEQGRVQGANQSLQSITRIIGPLLASVLFAFNWSAPYILCTLLSLFAVGYMYFQRTTINGHIDDHKNS